MATLTRATALFTVAGVLAFSAGAFAADPTQADYDACNREAQMAGGTPAASPGAAGTSGTLSSGAGTGASGGVGAGTTGSGVSGGVSAGTPGAGVSGGASGGTTGAGVSGSATGSSGSTVSGGTTTESDPLLRGMASAGQSDTAFQQAYRDCMRRRGF